MIEKLIYMWPEVTLFVATCLVMVVGLSPSQNARRLCSWITGLALLLAAGLAAYTPANPDALFPELIPYFKGLTAVVGLMLLLALAGTVDRDLEGLISQGKLKFNPLQANRAEFYSFFLFSLTGLMLCATADDLIWLFLALELTSLPTYVMVVISTRGTRSQEAGVKYFFLGALGAAVFLYGFALLYGAGGSTDFNEIRQAFATDGLGAIGTAGMLIALLGVSFKIAAVPMHFYTPDVYQGAASPVSAMLAFVPKAAGFISIFALCGLVGWGSGAGEDRLPEAVHAMLWVVAALTMTVGNVLATLQDSVKRMLAYSSIAHSGYMLVGVLAGPGDTVATNGLAAVLFYLLCYGVMNVGVFAVLGSLRNAKGEEPDSIAELQGLAKTHPLHGWVIILCTLSLLGFPPLLGFLGKVPLFTSGVSAGMIPLVLILGMNSAIAAFYYLRLVATVYLESKDEEAGDIGINPIVARPIAAAISAGGVIVLLVAVQPLLEAAHTSSRFNALDAPASASTVEPDSEPAAEADAPVDLAEPIASID